MPALGLVTEMAPPRRLNCFVMFVPEAPSPARATPLARTPMSSLLRLPSWTSAPTPARYEADPAPQAWERYREAAELHLARAAG